MPAPGQPVFCNGTVGRGSCRWQRHEEYAQGGSPRAVALAAMPQDFALPPPDPPGLRWGCLGTLRLSPGPCSCSTHTLWCVPLKPGHAPLAESQLSTLIPDLCFCSLGPVPEPTTPSTAGWRGAVPGNSPGRSIFHLGLFWSIRTDCPCPWPLVWPGCLGAAPFGLGRDEEGGAAAGGAEKDSLSSLQFRFKSKLLRSQLRERERKHARESKPQHNHAGGQQALLRPPLPPASTRWHTPLSCRQEPQGSRGWRELGAARPHPAFPANSGLYFS